MLFRAMRQACGGAGYVIGRLILQVVPFAVANFITLLVILHPWQNAYYLDMDPVIWLNKIGKIPPILESLIPISIFYFVTAFIFAFKCGQKKYDVGFLMFTTFGLLPFLLILISTADFIFVSILHHKIGSSVISNYQLNIAEGSIYFLFISVIALEFYMIFVEATNEMKSSPEKMRSQ